MRVIRLVVIVGFLAMFVVSGYWDALSSLQTHETTIDIVQWPVWIAKAALPLAALGWALAEIAKFLRQFGGLYPAVGQQSPLDE